MRAHVRYVDASGQERMRWVTPRSYHDDGCMIEGRAGEHGRMHWYMRLEDDLTDEVFYVRMQDIVSWADHDSPGSSSRWIEFGEQS